MWVAHDKHVAIADDADDRITTIPRLGADLHDVFDVEHFGNFIRDIMPIAALIAQATIQIRVGLIEVETDFFEDCLRVCAEYRMLAALDEFVVQFTGIGHVKIPHHHQGARRPVAAAQVRMAGAGIELSRGAVTQVTDENFATEVEVFFYARWDIRVELFLAGEFIEPFDLIAK